MSRATDLHSNWTGRISPLALASALTAMVVAVPGCDDDDDATGGTLRVTVYGEPFIEQGIPAEEMVDGWAVSFSTFSVEITDVAADGTPISSDATSSAWELATDTMGAGQVYGSASLDGARVNTLTYRLGDMRVVGQATREGETIAFDWTLPGPTTYENCETEQALSEDADATSQITVHADHLFYDDLVSEAPNVAFDLIASADADADGNVTQAELAAVDITALDRYQVGDAGITDLWSYIVAQSATVGHIDGEGHCDVGS